LIRACKLKAALPILLLALLSILPTTCQDARAEKNNHFFYCADRNSFPEGTQYFDYDSRPWKDDESAQIAKLLNRIKKDAPGVVEMASQHGKIAILRSPYIPYKNILGKTTKAYVLAVDGALFIGDGAEKQKDLKRLLLHELVHMADLGRHVAYSQRWSNFARPALQTARRQVSCQFLLDSKTSDFADQSWPSTDSCTSLKESLCEFVTRYVLDANFKKQFKGADSAIEPLLNPSKTDLSLAKHFMAGRIHFRSNKVDAAITEFELSVKDDENAPSPHVFLAQCWFLKSDKEKARKELEKACELFERTKVSMTESLHWRTVSMLANSFMSLEKFDKAKILLDRLALSRVQYDASIFQRRSLCNEKQNNLQQALLDFYDYQFLNQHTLDSTHYFDFVEDKAFLPTFLQRHFPNRDGRRSHVFSICWERLALASTGEERSKFVRAALAEVAIAAAAGYYSKDEETVRKRFLGYVNGEKPTDYEKLVEVEANKKLWREFDVIRYLSGKPLPPRGSEEFAKVLSNAQPTDGKETKWLF